jgi:AcrR family transcriptional regulator
MTSQCHNSGAEEIAAGVLNRDIPQPILDATRASVLAVGVRRTTLTDVARRAGVSRMTVYRLVPDVTTLILEVMSREFAALFAAAEADARRRRTARARIAGTTTSVVRRLHDAPLFHRVLDVDPELLLPYLTERWGTTQRIAAAQIRRMLADGQADGSVRRGDLDTMALALVLMVTPFVVSARMLDEAGAAPLLTELERVVDAALRP